MSVDIFVHVRVRTCLCDCVCVCVCGVCVFFVSTYILLQEYIIDFPRIT